MQSEAENYRTLFYQSEQVRAALLAQLEQERIYRASVPATIEAMRKRAEMAEAKVDRLMKVLEVLG